MNPVESDREGENIESSLSWPIFREPRLGVLDFAHALSTSAIASISSRRTMPPPPTPPPGLVNAACPDSYARSWIKIDSYFPVFGQDEWGSIYIRDLYIWVSLI